MKIRSLFVCLACSACSSSSGAPGAGAQGATAVPASCGSFSGTTGLSSTGAVLLATCSEYYAVSGFDAAALAPADPTQLRCPTEGVACDCLHETAATGVCTLTVVYLDAGLAAACSEAKFRAQCTTFTSYVDGGVVDASASSYQDAAADSCSQLALCCGPDSGIDPLVIQGCGYVLKNNKASTCAETLANLEDGGVCP
jgi:hypothetical protein